MKIEIFINQGIHESRIAIVEDGTLAEIWVERPESERMVGDIYLGKVNAVLPSLQAAFVDIGLERTAFLQVRDMVEADNDDEDGGSGRRNGRRPRQYPPIQDLVKKGQEILVQITKEPISTKGARITTQIALAGRFVVLMPTGDWVGVSRKISSWNERRRLRDVVRKLTPEGYSCIVRTEGRDQKEKGFRKDLKQLQRTHRRLSKKAKRAKAPALVHQELGMTSSVIRDVFTDDIDRLVVDSRELYNEIQDYLKSVSPDLRKRVSFHRDKKPIFDHFKLETELEKVTDREVWMRRGGSLVIDHAEAGTFIDVNSARNTGKRDQEESILITNLEAAKEIRVRGLRHVDMRNVDLKAGDAVTVRAAHDLYLENTRFSQGLPRVLLEATTINLRHVDFPASAQVNLNSLKGPIDGRYPNFGTNVSAAQELGRVNFLQNVQAGGNLMDTRTSFDLFGGNITIGRSR